MSEPTSTGDWRMVRDLQSRLEATPPTGRDAVLQAYLPRLSRHRSPSAVSLMVRIASHVLPGISAALIAELAETLHPEVLVRTVPFLPQYPSYPMRYLLERLRWQEMLPLVADIRDGRASLSSVIPPDDSVLAVAVLLAKGEHVTRESAFNLHRATGAESVFLFGASRNPLEYLRAIESVRIYTWPRPNRDPALLAWALRNPALGGTPRERMLRKNSPEALAPCRALGLLRTVDLHRWVVGDTTEVITYDRTTRALAVLALGDDVPGAEAFKKLALGSVERLDHLAAHMAPGDVAALETVLPLTSPVERETAMALLPGWAGDLASLAAAAQVLPHR